MRSGIQTAVQPHIATATAFKVDTNFPGLGASLRPRTLLGYFLEFGLTSQAHVSTGDGTLAEGVTEPSVHHETYRSPGDQGQSKTGSLACLQPG